MFDETVLQSVLCTPSGVLRYVIETADLDDVLEVGQTDWTPNLKVHRFTHLALKKGLQFWCILWIA
jgi:hypothetical protein